MVWQTVKGRDACSNARHHWADQYAVPDRNPQTDGAAARAKADRDGNHYSHSNRYATNAVRM